MAGFMLTQSIAMLFGVAIAIILSIIGFFIGNIILFESIGFAIAAGCFASDFLHIHPAFCLLLGIGVLIGLNLLMRTKFGVLLIGGLMSLLWGLLVAAIVYGSTGKDMIWTYVSWGLVSFVIFGVHLHAKSKSA
jgi:hypothetical protein